MASTQWRECKYCMENINGRSNYYQHGSAEHSLEQAPAREFAKFAKARKNYENKQASLEVWCERERFLGSGICAQWPTIRAMVEKMHNAPAYRGWDAPASPLTRAEQDQEVVSAKKRFLAEGQDWWSWVQSAQNTFTRDELVWLVAVWNGADFRESDADALYAFNVLSDGHREIA